MPKRVKRCNQNRRLRPKGGKEGVKRGKRKTWGKGAQGAWAGIERGKRGRRDKKEK